MLKFVIASAAKQSMAQRKEWMLRLAAPGMTASLSHPSHLWGGRAHRERRERCDGWGVSSVRELPHPALRATLRASFARLDPTEDGGGIRKSSRAQFQISKQPASHPHLRDLVGPSLRRAKLAVSFPSHLWAAERSSFFLFPPTLVEPRRAKLALGWREAPGWGPRNKCEIPRLRHQPPPVTSFAPLPMCHPPHKWEG
jgi:hypothetical protein